MPDLPHLRSIAPRLLAVLAAAGLALSIPAQAQSADPAETAFWQSIETSKDPAEFQAYLDVYPNGRFAAKARSHLARPAAAANPPKVAGVWLRPAKASVALVEGVTLDLDATGLRDSSNVRLIVVASASPDGVADAESFVETATSVPASRQHLTIPPGPPGADEVRLYHIPRYGSDYVIAARAPVTVGAGVRGAVLSRDLARESAKLGPLRFEANHRDRPLLIQAAFLRARPETEWNALWFKDGLNERVAVISIGQPNVAPDIYGSTGEAVCIVGADDAATMDRLASLNVGDPISVRAIPTSWDSASASDPILLKDCTLTH